jgi:hypothetical protein
MATTITNSRVVQDRLNERRCWEPPWMDIVGRRCFMVIISGSGAVCPGGRSQTDNERTNERTKPIDVKVATTTDIGTTNCPTSNGRTIDIVPQLLTGSCVRTTEEDTFWMGGVLPYRLWASRHRNDVCTCGRRRPNRTMISYRITPGTWYIHMGGTVGGRVCMPTRYTGRQGPMNLIGRDTFGKPL